MNKDEYAIYLRLDNGTYWTFHVEQATSHDHAVAKARHKMTVEDNERITEIRVERLKDMRQIEP